jgi:hypothetical protein
MAFAAVRMRKERLEISAAAKILAKSPPRVALCTTCFSIFRLIKKLRGEEKYLRGALNYPALARVFWRTRISLFNAHVDNGGARFVLARRVAFVNSARLMHAQPV